MGSSVVISKFPSTGRTIPPERLGLRSLSIALQCHLGRVLSSPTQVCPLLWFLDSGLHSRGLTGGPGESGVNFVLDHGETLSNLTGGYYDIVSWDPRGVGNTTWVAAPLHRPHPFLLTSRSSPGLINCFHSLDEYNSFWNGTLVNPQIDIKYGFSDPSDLEYFNSQVDIMEERWLAFGEVCLKHKSGQFLPYVGTTATVRDLVAIAEYLDGKGCDINYYASGYGTTIGIYLVNSESIPFPISHPDSQSIPPVFPDRVGRIILDGMQNPVIRTSVPSHLSWAHLIESTDETFQGFAYGCALAGPHGCPLATNTSTGPGIIEWTKDLLEVCMIPIRRLLIPHHIK